MCIAIHPVDVVCPFRNAVLLAGSLMPFVELALELLVVSLLVAPSCISELRKGSPVVRLRAILAFSATLVCLLAANLDDQTPLLSGLGCSLLTLRQGAAGAVVVFVCLPPFWRFVQWAWTHRRRREEALPHKERCNFKSFELPLGDSLQNVRVLFGASPAETDLESVMDPHRTKDHVRDLWARMAKEPAAAFQKFLAVIYVEFQVAFLTAPNKPKGAICFVLVDARAPPGSEVTVPQELGAKALFEKFVNCEHTKEKFYVWNARSGSWEPADFTEGQEELRGVAMAASCKIVSDDTD
jgi:hypothetical protein